MGRAKPARDRWAEWLLDRRFAGDVDKHREALKHYNRISQDLLDHSRRLAEEMGVADRCDFVRASADDLSALEDASVDVVVTRSVSIYVKDKRRAFGEFRRVLRLGRRLSIWEPINSFTYPEPTHLFHGYEVVPVRELADKVKAVYERIQPAGTDPMLDFDERDLLAIAEEAGFAKVCLDYEVKIASYGASDDETRDWASFARIPGNPQIPSVEEAVDEVLTPEEAERFVAHLRPLVEEGRGTERWAVARLWAVK